MKLNKGTILKASVDHMQDQEMKVNSLQQMNVENQARIAEQQRTIEHLTQTLESLQQLLQGRQGVESPVGSLTNGTPQ